MKELKMKKIVYIKEEVAEILDCSVTKINILIRDKKINYFKFGLSKQSPVKFSGVHIADYLKSVER